MDIFTRKEFLRLAEIHDQHCISIYISTHRMGGDSAEMQDRTSFKNQLKEVKAKLKNYNLTDTQIQDYTNQLNELHQNEDFWRRLSDTLAIFVYDGQMKYYLLPINLDRDFNYVADHLYLKPLAPFVNKNNRFFILMLSMGKVRFFDASSHNITEVDVEGLVPRELEETIAINFGEEQKQLQWRSQQGEPDQASMFHGHGAGSDTEKKQLAEKFFKEIDRGLMEMLHDEKAPMVIASVEYLYPIYKSVNSYKYLSNHHLTGNFEEVNPAELHAQAWDMINDDFSSDLENLKDRYHELLKADKAAYKLEEVIPGSIVGRTETLFIEKGKNIWGRFKEEDHAITVDEAKEIQNACLLNKSAIGTIVNGGDVIELESETMPDQAEVAAIFRYEMK